MAALSHADVLSRILRRDIGQMKSFYFGPVALQGLREGEMTLATQNIINHSAVLLWSVDQFSRSGP